MTEVRQTGPFERVMTLTIPVEALEAGKKTAAARLAKEAKVKGFRPGKAPLKVVESMVGVEVLRKEAIDDALPAVLTKALDEADLLPSEAGEICLGPSGEILASEQDRSAGRTV